MLREQEPDKLWMEAFDDVAGGLAALDGDRVTGLTRDHDRQMVMEALQAQLDELAR